MSKGRLEDSRESEEEGLRGAYKNSRKNLQYFITSELDGNEEIKAQLKLTRLRRPQMHIHTHNTEK